MPIFAAAVIIAVLIINKNLSQSICVCYSQVLIPQKKTQQVVKYIL